MSKLKHRNLEKRIIGIATTIRMKDTLLRIKRKAENSFQHDEQYSPAEYATDEVSRAADDAVREVSGQAKKAVGQVLDKVKTEFRQQHSRFTARDERRSATKQGKPKSVKVGRSASSGADNLTNPTQQSATSSKPQERAKAYAQKRTQATAQQSVSNSVNATRRTESAIKQSVRATEAAATTTKRATENSIIQATKGAVKTAQKSVKTAQATAKTTIKTSRQATRTAQKTAQATVRAAKAAEKAAYAALKAAVHTAKVIAKATMLMVKGIIAALKGLVAAIAAGGWVAVLIIVVICLVGCIVCSSFGIFFSGEPDTGSVPMPQMVAELGAEFYDRIEQIKADNPHDRLEIYANDGVLSIHWDEVLVVYAVKVATDPENGMEVVTIDDAKKNILRSVMWDMNVIDYWTWIDYIEVTSTTTDDDGNESETTEIIEIKVLTISITHKTHLQMADQYRFNAKQREQLTLLMDDEYKFLWARLLGGYRPGGGQIIDTGSDKIPTGIFSWPLPSTFTITSAFGERADPFTGESQFHTGLDIAAPAGTPVLAAADAVVTIANATDSWGYGYGFYVKLQHPGTAFETLYGHCSAISVFEGQEVKKGEVIGYVGTTGYSSGNHLHFEVIQSGVVVDPLGFFR